MDSFADIVASSPSAIDVEDIPVLNEDPTPPGGPPTYYCVIA